MHENHGVAAVQLVEQWIELLLTQGDAAAVRKQHDSVSMKLVERVSELRQRPLYVGQRQRRKEAEAPGMLAHDLGRELVDLASFVARLGVVAQVHARGRD